jgi:hypothetical protein
MISVSGTHVESENVCEVDSSHDARWTQLSIKCDHELDVLTRSMRRRLVGQSGATPRRREKSATSGQQ